MDNRKLYPKKGESYNPTKHKYKSQYAYRVGLAHEAGYESRRQRDKQIKKIKQDPLFGHITSRMTKEERGGLAGLLTDSMNGIGRLIEGRTEAAVVLPKETYDRIQALPNDIRYPLWRWLYRR